MNKLGFGFLRLPRTDPEDDTTVDFTVLNEMVDTFLASGGTYFDTAYTYLGGMSETAVRRALVERYPRSAFTLADKLPSWKVKKKEDCERYFAEQCGRCGVDYFDIYLLHWLNRENYAIAEQFDEFAFLQKLKIDGKAGRIGFSYHGDADLLEEILSAHPEVDIVQLQINYLDWESPALEARRCYETAERFHKEIVVMEPVKGGTLASLPEEAEVLLRAHAPQASIASWAIRFAQALPQVHIVLSGMNTMEQLLDNIQADMLLSDKERELLDAVCTILRQSIAIPCTACRYCVSHCPEKIAIPDYFSIYNEYQRNPADGWKITPVYTAIAGTHGKASGCIGCHSCERNCPQRIAVSRELSRVAAVFEK